jgi:hypothetical protein
MEAKESFLGQLLQRLTTETPKFFKKILNFAIILGGVGTALLAIDVTNLPIDLPPIFFKIAGYMVTAGVVAGVVAKSATTNPTLQDAGGSLARTPRKD